MASDLANGKHQAMTASLVTVSDANLRERFRRLTEEWKETFSVSVQLGTDGMLKPYQRIIGMGLPAVPLILAELRREPDQ